MNPAARFTVIIPARYASSRFPAKPLADIAGKPMVVRVCERAAKSGAAGVHVATDDERIARAVRVHGHSALMTRADHGSGTERIAEAAAALGLAADHIVVNVQGDEPLIEPELIAQVGSLLHTHGDAAMSTACHEIRDPAALGNPNVVKVVLDARGYALYFSRSQIPYPREQGGRWYRHAGIYGYRVRFLREYATLTPTGAERFEALEQLRALGHGHRIAVAHWNEPMEAGVDTPADLERVRARLGG